jgi:hypothetical protein
MATLTIPHNFVAGTPALASEVNANFQAIVSWTQSNIGTDNLGILSARSVALPSSPQYAILSINQTASQPALNVSNTGSDTAVTVTQGGLLATGKSVFLISDSISQTASGAAHMKMSLSGTTTIPALEIKHGVQNTLTVSRTAISTDLGITSAGTIAANALSSTTSISAASVTSTGLVTITAPVSDSIAVKVKGRSSDDRSELVLKNNADSTTFASIIGSSSGLGLNIPDTTDKYDFQINGVTKAVIDNNGLDGAYLKTASVTLSKKEPTPLTNISWGSGSTSGGTAIVIYSTTISVGGNGAIVFGKIVSGSFTYSGAFGNFDLSLYVNGIRIYGPEPQELSAVSTAGITGFAYLTAGTYTVQVYAYRPGGTSATWTAGSAQFVVL